MRCDLKDIDVLETLANDLRGILRENLNEMKGKAIAPQDFARLVSSLQSVYRLVAEKSGDEWMVRLQEVFEASDAIDELAREGQPDRFKKWLFDRPHPGKKKPILRLRGQLTA